MNDEVYRQLARVLDTLPNGFPSTENGVEIKLLKKIFTPEQAELFCRMRLTFETAEDVAKRTGLPLEGLEARLEAMAEAGQLFMIGFGPVKYFKMMPWAFGIYEFQLGRLDREFAELNEEFSPVYGRGFFAEKPQLMQTLAVERTISVAQEALPYEKVSSIIEHGQSFLVNDCICKKEQDLLGKTCDRPLQVCLAIAPVPGIFDNSPRGRVLTRSEAYELLNKAEEDGLVHLTSNLQHGHIYICNCCKCCCGVLRAINELGLPAGHVINAHHYAEIDREKCLGCGLCAEQRCQVGAIVEEEGTYRIVKEGCIGCGLCIGTCPGEAISLVHKGPDEVVAPPTHEAAWFEERARQRGVDYSQYK